NASHSTGYLKVFHRRQFVLDAGSMTDIRDRRKIFLTQLHYLDSVPSNGSLHRLQKAAQHAKQAGLAAAIGSRQAKAVACAHGKADVAKNLSISAHAFQMRCFEHVRLLFSVPGEIE